MLPASTERLQEMFNQLMDEASRLADTDPQKSEVKRAEAEDVGAALKEIERKQQGDQPD